MGTRGSGAPRHRIGCPDSRSSLRTTFDSFRKRRGFHRAKVSSRRIDLCAANEANLRSLSCPTLVIQTEKEQSTNEGTKYAPRDGVTGHSLVKSAPRLETSGKPLGEEPYGGRGTVDEESPRKRRRRDDERYARSFLSLSLCPSICLSICLSLSLSLSFEFARRNNEERNENNRSVVERYYDPRFYRSSAIKVYDRSQRGP